MYKRQFLNSQVYTLAGIDESGTVVTVGILRAVLIFVETAAWPVRASIAGTGRTVPSGTAEREILRTVGSTMPAKDTGAIVCAFKRKPALMSKLSVEFDFFSDGRFILSDDSGDGGFRRAIGNAGKNDATFLQS